MGNGEFFQQIVWGQLDIHIKKKKLDSFLTLYAEINLKWIKSLNVSQNYKLLEETVSSNMEENFHDLGFNSVFLDMVPKAKIK